jgi:hypothetical protein
LPVSFDPSNLSLPDFRQWGRASAKFCRLTCTRELQSRLFSSAWRLAFRECASAGESSAFAICRIWLCRHFLPT